MAERVLLDTSALISILDGEGDKKLLENECHLSIVSIYEFIRYKRNYEEHKLLLEDAFEIISITNSIVLKASEIFVRLKKSGLVIDENDIYIAATAIVSGLKLYTLDKDFMKVKKLFPEMQLTVTE